jgi:glycolate oxidase FAD binding subunit
VETLHPHTRRDVVDILRAATTERSTLLPVGGRSHLDKGNPTVVEAEMWTTQLDRVVAYDPAEMIAIVEGGVRVGALRRSLAEGDQEWPVDAPDEATVGGVIASGVNPWRVMRVGAMRDTVVQMRAVTGDGRLVKSGAATVKNVTGYDVHRLLCGSLGTLGVIVEVALKVRPLPKATRTLVAHGEDNFALSRNMLEALPLASAIVASPSDVVLRIEGWPEEVDEQSAVARVLVERSGADLTDEETASAEQSSPADAFARAPIVAEAAVVPSRLEDLLRGCSDWRALIGVGTAWVAVGSGDELAGLQERAARLGGIAPVVRGFGGLGDAPIPALEVHRRLKAAFDPAGVLAPGRGWGGI